MSVVKIKVLNLIGRMSELEKVTTALGESCVFHPDNVFSFYSDTSGFSPIADENPYGEALRKMTDTLKLANKRVDLLSVREVKKLSPASIGDWAAYAEHIYGSFGALLEERASHQQKIASYNREIEKYSHFLEMDINFEEIRKCEYIKIRLGVLPKESYEKLSEYQENPYVAFFPCSEDENHLWGAYCVPIDQAEEVDRIFSGLYFERIGFDEANGTPGQIYKELRSLRDREREQIRGLEQKSEELWKREKQTFQKVYSWLSGKHVYYDIRRYAARYGDSFILTGWVPASEEASVKKLLDPFKTVKYALDGAEDPEVLLHSPPVELHNRKLFSPFEFFIRIYGMPCYDEMDPTPFIAFTYALIFGIMFADLGQGLCVSLAGWIMYRKFKMQLGRALVPCGIFSAIFGTLFGSVFGFEHALDPLYKGVFGLKEKPISVLEPEFTIKVIYSAVGIGILLVIMAIIMNIISSLRRKRYENGLFGPNGVAGLVFYCSIVFGAMASILGNHVMTPAYVILLIIVPILCMLFRDVLGGLAEGRPDWKPESMGGYVMQNFFEVFEFLLSYLTNTISFIRVGAFVLVHAGMMLVVFTLAGSSVSVGYVITIVFGNVFIIALEGLLSGIQTLRLEFYEMFSRFFDGDGRAYEPVVVGQES